MQHCQSTPPLNTLARDSRPPKQIKGSLIAIAPL